MRVLLILPVLMVVSLGLALGPANRAAADGGSGGSDVHVAQTMGDRELTVVLRRVTGVPGPLRVEALLKADSPAGRLDAVIVPAGVSEQPVDATTDEATLVLTAGDVSATTLDVDRTGPWELRLDDGERQARIPFTVFSSASSPAETLVFAGFATAGGLLVVTLVAATRVRNPAWLVLPGGGLVAAVAVAVSAALLSPTIPAPAAVGTQVDATVENAADPYESRRPEPDEYGRPPVTLDLPDDPVPAGESTDLRLSVTDSSTGLPADDLIVHDDALIHVLVVGPAGDLWHRHPIRTGEGVYQLTVDLPDRGHYAVSAELVRRGGGAQTVRLPGGLEVDDGPAGSPSPESGPGEQTVDGVPVTVSTTGLEAGEPATITARIGESTDLQLWLGMVGHLVIAGPLADSTSGLGSQVEQARVWAHGHSMGSTESTGTTSDTTETDAHGMDMAPSGAGDALSSEGDTSMLPLSPVNGDSRPDESVAMFGPDLSFVFTFPELGHYRIWIQVQRELRLVTVPVDLDVPDGE